MSVSQLFECLPDDVKEMFHAFPPALLCGAGLIVEVLKTILSIRNSNARDARYKELRKTFPDFFDIVFLVTCFEIFSDSEELTSEFVNSLDSYFKDHYSSKKRLCKTFTIEQIDKVDSYLDACFREFRGEVQSFIASLQPRLDAAQLPDSFPNSDAAAAAADESSCCDHD
jgi:hypothetical protein